MGERIIAVYWEPYFSHLKPSVESIVSISVSVNFFVVKKISPKRRFCWILFVSLHEFRNTLLYSA